ncbi:uncharacterized protein LAJ45_00171 [Morchella importuna]|uniref:uncharacterized protein n=1 Tax=Morchella importuna TaxID=1174673 RepID=UPI001E8DF197|nr:uncharacterized protein LAJ45_00171 [Morchella importuna]KAH8155162.1 hypothetical protein LAJ45_00171 [Morchella importuna]
MSRNNEDFELIKHTEDHEIDDHDDDNNEKDDGLNVDDYNFPLPPSTTILPLNLGKKDTSLASTHSPTISLETNRSSPRFSRTPTRAKRPRQTLKTFEDLRGYNQNRSQAQARVDPPEQPRTLFRDLDAEGNVVYDSPSSPSEHISKDSWSSILRPGGHESHDEFNSNIFQHSSPRQENRYQDISRQTSPEPESMNEPGVSHVNENSPFRHIPDCNASQDVNAESQHKSNDLKCVRQETMRPTEYPELVARDTAGNNLSESHSSFSEILPTQTYENLPPRRQGELQLVPVRGFNIMKTNSQLLAEARIGMGNSLNDTNQPPVSTPRPIRTSSFSSYYNYLIDFSKSFTVPSKAEELNHVHNTAGSSSIPNNVSGALLADVSSPYSPESRPGEEENLVPKNLIDNDQAQEPEELERDQKPQIPEKAHLNPFSNKPSVLFENDDSTCQITAVPRSLTGPGNSLGYPPPMWAGSKGYTSKPRVSDATQDASTPASFGSTSSEGTPPTPNPPSSPASTSRVSSPDLSIEHDNLSKTETVARASKRSFKGWRMRLTEIRGKISRGTVWSSLRGKDGPKSSPDPEPTTTKTAPAKRTKRLIKKTSHMRRNPHANSASADHLDGEALVNNAPKNDAREEKETPAAESLGDGAKRSTGDTALGDKISMGSPDLHPSQPVEPDTIEVVSSTPPSGRISGFCSKTLTALSRIWNVGIEPTFGKLKLKVVLARVTPQPVYMRGARETPTLTERVKYKMGLGGRSRREVPDGGENPEGVETTPEANLPEYSPSIASIRLPSIYNPRNSDEVETRQLVDPVKETIAARGSKGLWSSTDASTPKQLTRESLRGVLAKSGNRGVKRSD